MRIPDSKFGARVRVLLVAEACNPSWPSVPLVGYNFARALSERFSLDITLATHVRNRSALEQSPIRDLSELHFIDNEFIASPLHKLSRWIRGGGLSWTIDTAMAWPAYMVFERLVFRHFAGRLRRRDFDLIHRVTPLSPTMGSPLCSLTKVPMVIGPLNGGLPWPEQHPSLWRREREWLAPLRAGYKLLPYYKSTYRNAAAVIFGSNHTANEAPPWFAGRRYYLPENGLDQDRFPIAESWPEPDGRFRFVTLGRLVPYKGMDLILDAIGGSDLLKSCELEVIGDGPMRPELDDKVRELGLEDVVTFAGNLEQREVARRLARSQAFVFPSLREFGGAVVLEAMASGLPSIIVNYGGPAELATVECALRLPMASRGELIGALRHAMEVLASDHDLCRSMGQAAIVRVKSEFTWDVKAMQIEAIYREILSKTVL